MGKKNDIFVLKYGTSTLTRSGGGIDQNNMNDHGRVIGSHPDRSIVMVSSGAVGFGRSIAKERFSNVEDPTLLKRKLAALGQPQLVQEWAHVIPRLVQQVLVSNGDLRHSETKDLLLSALDPKELALFNWNDAVSDQELQGDETKFGDNDHLASSVASLLAQETQEQIVNLVFHTTTRAGVNDEKGRLLPEISLKDLTEKNIQRWCRDGKSTEGTGGMASKLREAASAIKRGVLNVFIINGKDPGALDTVLKGGHVGTKIIA